MNQEIWMLIPGYQGYEASSFGRIKNIKTGTIRKLRLKKSGYLSVKIKQKHLLVHRLIAATFIPNAGNKPEVNHKDRNRVNNSSQNLEWVTPSENSKHSFANGRIPKPTTKGMKGVLCVNSKPILSVKDVSIMEFESQTELCDQLKISRKTIIKFIDTGRSYNGFQFYRI